MYFSSCIALAAAVAATPLTPRKTPAAVSLTHVNNAESLEKLAASGHARLAAMNHQSPAVFNIDASGGVTNGDVTYTAAINVGGKPWNLIVDTGSSNLWCGVHAACEFTKTGQYAGGNISVTYGSGSFYGTGCTDMIGFAGLTAKMTFANATRSSGFGAGVDGIVGFGPVALTIGTYQNTPSLQIPTFMDQLKYYGQISAEVLGVYFKPLSGSDTSETNGELTLGGIDSSKYTGSLSYYPRLTTSQSPIGNYWSIAISSFSYGSTTLASNMQGVIDTGTTLIYIPASAYNAFLSAANGTTVAGVASFTTKPTQNFNIVLGSRTFPLTPAQYLIPQAQYANFGLPTGQYFSWIANGGTGALNTLIGQKFLENYYSVFDTDNGRIGFATAV